MSHSTRVRGLKFACPAKLDSTFVSHSTRVRGLKCRNVLRTLKIILVALYTSAWIEICCKHVLDLLDRVALYTSAWIEMRWHIRLTRFLRVALYTSAWIEIWL